MKKLYVLFIMTITVLLVACGGEEAPNNNDPVDTNNTEEKVDNEEGNAENNADLNENDDSGVAVEKGLLSNRITIPLDFLFMDEELDEGERDEIIEEVKENGAKDVKVTEDEMSFKISKSDHKKLMKEMREDLEESFEEYATDEEFVSIEKVEANKDFTKVDVTINVAAFEEALFDGFAVIGIGIGSMMYQAFDGVESDHLSTTVQFIDSDTGDVYDSVQMPEDLEEMGE